MDLRERIVAACAAGQSQVAVSRVFGVSQKTVNTFCRLAAQGQLAPRPILGRPRRVDADGEKRLGQLLGEKRDWTIEELCLEWQQRTGDELPRSTMHDALRRVGARYKKKSRGPGTQ